MKNPIEIAFVKEASAQYYGKLPGMCTAITYDYINEYIYINIPENSKFSTLGTMIVESVFEYPHLIKTETVEGKLDIDNIDDNDEFLLPEAITLHNSCSIQSKTCTILSFFGIFSGFSRNNMLKYHHEYIRI